jgi:hypothetical protein
MLGMDELKSLPDEAAREAFAVRCGSSLGHLRNVMYGLRTCAEELGVALERESGGALPCELVCPGIRWHRIKDAAWKWHPKGRPVIDVTKAVA